jgi:hypothetical protein
MKKFLTKILHLTNYYHVLVHVSERINQNKKRAYHYIILIINYI